MGQILLFIASNNQDEPPAQTLELQLPFLWRCGAAISRSKLLFAAYIRQTNSIGSERPNV